MIFFSSAKSKKTEKSPPLKLKISLPKKPPSPPSQPVVSKPKDSENNKIPKIPILPPRPTSNSVAATSGPSTPKASPKINILPIKQPVDSVRKPESPGPTIKINEKNNLFNHNLVPLPPLPYNGTRGRGRGRGSRGGGGAPKVNILPLKPEASSSEDSSDGDENENDELVIDESVRLTNRVRGRGRGGGRRGRGRISNGVSKQPRFPVLPPKNSACSDQPILGQLVTRPDKNEREVPPIKVPKLHIKPPVPDKPILGK